ncbi:MAG TPA: hypothetical protein VFW71_10880 [Actinomycetota bacterium]|nr:hypothetical protein [Actinomycetota bacterium]
MTSQRVWSDLVEDQGWSTARYRRHLTALLEAALLAPEPEPQPAMDADRTAPGTGTGEDGLGEAGGEAPTG